MDVETMTILGATAVLSGATRMTYSLAVIMMETTQNVSLFLPIIFTLFSSYGAASILISKSIYAGALRSKNIPVLGKSIPKANRNLSASSMMSSPVASFNFIERVENVYYQLSNTEFNGFPVLNPKGQPIGIIERDTLVVLLGKQAWYKIGNSDNQPKR